VVVVSHALPPLALSLSFLFSPSVRPFERFFLCGWLLLRCFRSTSATLYTLLLLHKFRQSSRLLVEERLQRRKKKKKEIDKRQYYNQKKKNLQ
jgi:hypothetical protein